MRVVYIGSFENGLKMEKEKMIIIMKTIILENFKKTR